MSQRAEVASYIEGAWVTGDVALTSSNPLTGEAVTTAPKVSWSEIDRAVSAGVEAYEAMQEMSRDSVARFLESFAAHIEAEAQELAKVAHLETGLPVEPRLLSVEIPRTTDQLRQAGSAAADRSWVRATIDSRSEVRSMLTPLPGPVVTFGPNNFPFAFSSMAGGDAAAALATGHPLIAKAHPSHLRTSALLMDCAVSAAEATGMPASVVQILYDIEPADGLRLVADRRLAAIGFTGGRSTGLALKSAADSAGVPIFLEMASINPVVVLPEADRVEGHQIASELAQSINLGTGQFCTKPGLIFVTEGSSVVSHLASAVERADGGILMSEAVCSSFHESLRHLTQAGATPLASSRTPEAPTGVATSLFRLAGQQFRADPSVFQQEAFGPGALVVICSDMNDLLSCLELLDGNLTGTIFTSDTDEDFDRALAVLEPKVGRIAVNKAPTGVQVVSAMNHGGPFPATGMPWFTSVGIPRSLERFGKLTCYDGMPDHRLPPELQDANPLQLWRHVDGRYTKEPV